MRVIAGNYGGRPLKSLSGDHTRPTGDKIKETMFNIIGPFFNGGLALDLYAGSGALGIEAVSRGIDKAILVDKNRKALQVIQENVDMTKEKDKFEIMGTAAETALHQLAERQEKFNLILLDPPYAKQTIEEDILFLSENHLLADDVLVVCETDSDVHLPEAVGDLTIWRDRKYGKVRLTIFQKGD